MVKKTFTKVKDETLDATSEWKRIVHEADEWSRRNQRQVEFATAKAAFTSLWKDDEKWRGRLSSLSAYKAWQSFTDKALLKNYKIFKGTATGGGSSSNSSSSASGASPALHTQSKAPPTKKAETISSTATSSKAKPPPTTWEQGELDPAQWSAPPCLITELTRDSPGIALSSIYSIESVFAMLQGAENPCAVLVPENFDNAVNAADEIRDVVRANGTYITKVIFKDKEGNKHLKRGWLLQLSKEGIQDVTFTNVGQLDLEVDEVSFTELTVNFCCEFATKKLAEEVNEHPSRTIVGMIQSALGTYQKIMLYGHKWRTPTVYEVITKVVDEDAAKLLGPVYDTNAKGLFFRRTLRAGEPDPDAVVPLPEGTTAQQAILKAKAMSFKPAIQSKPRGLVLRVAAANVAEARRLVLPKGEIQDYAKDVVGKYVFHISNCARDTVPANILKKMAEKHSWRAIATSNFPCTDFKAVADEEPKQDEYLMSHGFIKITNLTKQAKVAQPAPTSPAKEPKTPSKEDEPMVIDGGAHDQAADPGNQRPRSPTPKTKPTEAAAPATPEAARVAKTGVLITQQEIAMMIENACKEQQEKNLKAVQDAIQVQEAKVNGIESRLVQMHADANQMFQAQQIQVSNLEKGQQESKAQYGEITSLLKELLAQKSDKKRRTDEADSEKGEVKAES